MRQPQLIRLSEEEHRRLTDVINAQSSSLKLVERANIILLAFNGNSNIEIAEYLGISRQKAARWRKRFIEFGIEGIEKDASRPGGREKLDINIVEKVIDLTLNHQPSTGKYWTQESIANECEISRSSVRRIWSRYKISPKQKII